MKNTAYQVRERKLDVKPKKMRKEKVVPGVIYGGAYPESLVIEMDQNELVKLMRENSYSSSIPLKGLTKKVNVIIKDIQIESLSGLPMHFDFQAISKGEIMSIAIPVRIKGEEELKGKDIYIQVELNEINLKGSIEKLPSYIEVDVSKLEINDRILLSDLNIPKDLEVIEEAEATVCIAHPSGIQSGDTKDAEATAAEVVTEEDKSKE